MSSVLVNPISKLSGQIFLPGDKSISHRLAMCAAIAEGTTCIANFSNSQDCAATLSCLKSLGVPIQQNNGLLLIEGKGLQGLAKPDHVLDAGNSGTTLRLLTGILAGQTFESYITGDFSLCNRPMDRIVHPLEKMGAKILTTKNKFAPLFIKGGSLNSIIYKIPIASAQVKSCLLFAGLFANGKTILMEPIPTRDHTERLFSIFGETIEKDQDKIIISGNSKLTSLSTVHFIPSDISAAAFFLIGALLVQESELILKNVGINPTRISLVKLLQEMGAELYFENQYIKNEEPITDIHLLKKRELRKQKIILKGNAIAGLIDELPILAILGTTLGGIEVRNAAELRVKESDRIRLIVDNLRQMNAQVTEFEDGFDIEGDQKLKGAKINSGGDHRIAMAFSIAALVADGVTEIINSDCVGVSFPNFYSVLSEVSQFS